MKYDNRRILHVLNIFFAVPYFLGEQLRYFQDKGYKEYLACSPSEELHEYARERGVGFIEPYISRSITLRTDLLAVWKVLRFIRRNKIGIVTGHTPKGSIVAMSAAWLARVPKRIYFRHGLVYETSTGLRRKLLIAIDRLTSWMATEVVCVSPSVMRRSEEDRLCPREKMRILHNGTCSGIDVDKYSREALEPATLREIADKHPAAEDTVTIGYVGRLVHDKGIEELVDAFEMLQAENTKARLLLVGMPEESDPLKAETIEKIERNSGIITTGYVRHDHTPYFYALMDVLILPSYREGFGMTILEASSMGLPVVATRVTGCVDAVVDGVTGLLAEVSARDIHEKLLRLCEDPSLRERLGKAGRERAVRDFSQEKVWAAIEELYRD